MTNSTTTVKPSSPGRLDSLHQHLQNDQISTFLTPMALHLRLRLHLRLWRLLEISLLGFKSFICRLSADTRARLRIHRFLSPEET